MNLIDVITFQAELAPDKLALVAHGSIIPYNRFVHGILSAQQRLLAIGVQCRSNRGALDHASDRSYGICLCALSHEGCVSIDHVFRGRLSGSCSIRHGSLGQDSSPPLLSSSRPPDFFWSSQAWFQDKIDFNVGQARTSSRREALDWVARVICYPERPGFPPWSKPHHRRWKNN